jgi:hypothetical protein
MFSVHARCQGFRFELRAASAVGPSLQLLLRIDPRRGFMDGNSIMSWNTIDEGRIAFFGIAFFQPSIRPDGISEFILLEWTGTFPVTLDCKFVTPALVVKHALQLFH